MTNPPLATAPGSTTVSQQVTLQSGVNYRIFAVGQSSSTVNAGLYSAVVAPSGGGAPVYSKVVPIGSVSQGQVASLTAGSSYTFFLVDLGVPSTLQSLGAVLTLNGQVASQLAAAGNSTVFTAVSGTYEIFALASTTSAGGYALTVVPQSGPAALSVARAVTASGGTQAAYSFDASVGTAGGYNLVVSDIGIPAPVTSLNALAVQNGKVLGTPLKTAGTASVTAAAGPVSLLLFAQPASSGGLLNVSLTPSGGGNPAFEVTQGVGQLFASKQLSIASSGSYAVDVSDLGFPAQFANFAAIITSGGKQTGSIYGGGAFSFSATPGNYFINFIAQPSGTSGAGTYAMTVAPAPVVTLQSSASTVTSGGTVSLTWTSQNATSCTASGGWSGSQALNGSATSAAITAATTFTLTCSGTGVDVAQSVSVSVDTPTKSGGGGALDVASLLLLLVIAVLKLLSYDRRSLFGCHATVTTSAYSALLASERGNAGDPVNVQQPT